MGSAREAGVSDNNDVNITVLGGKHKARIGQNDPRHGAGKPAQAISVVRPKRGQVKPTGNMEQANRPIGESRGQVVVGEHQTAAAEAVDVVGRWRIETEVGVDVPSHAEVVGRLMPVYVFLPPRVVLDATAAPVPYPPQPVVPTTEPTQVKQRYGTWMLVTRKKMPTDTHKGHRHTKKPDRTQDHRGNKFQALAADVDGDDNNSIPVRKTTQKMQVNPKSKSSNAPNQSRNLTLPRTEINRVAGPGKPTQTNNKVRGSGSAHTNRRGMINAMNNRGKEPMKDSHTVRIRPDNTGQTGSISVGKEGIGIALDAQSSKGETVKQQHNQTALTKIGFMLNDPKNFSCCLDSVKTNLNISLIWQLQMKA
nr:hypothetical protein Iba_chr04dCG4900 [Ipomoea batatas]